MTLPRGLDPEEWPRLLEHGDTGAPVASWQACLELLGLDITDQVGQFGDSTHNGTLAFQRRFRLGRDGKVGPQTRGKIGELNAPPSPAPSDALRPAVNLLGEIVFRQAKHYTAVLGGRVDPIWQVIHCTDGAESSTKAERVSKWFADELPNVRARRASAHYVADDDSVVQMVKLGDVAWGAKGANRSGIHYEQAGRARQTRAQWLDDFGVPMIENIAIVAAQNSARFDIPIRFVDAAGLKRREPGFTSHDECRKAFGGSHWDPGPAYPWDYLFSRVQLHMAADV